MRVWCGLTVYSDVYDLSILKDDATFDDSINDWIFKDGDLNNHVVLEKARENRKSISEKQNRWGELLRGSDMTNYPISLSDIISDLPEPPQEIEYTPF
jgi:hypothetical protein